MATTEALCTPGPPPPPHVELVEVDVEALEYLPVFLGPVEGVPRGTDEDVAGRVSVGLLVRCGGSRSRPATRRAPTRQSIQAAYGWSAHRKRSGSNNDTFFMFGTCRDTDTSDDSPRPSPTGLSDPPRTPPASYSPSPITDPDLFTDGGVCRQRPRPSIRIGEGKSCWCDVYTVSFQWSVIPESQRMVVLVRCLYGQLLVVAVPVEQCVESMGEARCLALGLFDLVFAAIETPYPPIHTRDLGSDTTASSS